MPSSSIPFIKPLQHMVCMNEGKAEIDFTCCEEQTLGTLEVNVALLQH